MWKHYLSLQEYSWRFTRHYLNLFGRKNPLFLCLQNSIRRHLAVSTITNKGNWKPRRRGAWGRFPKGWGYEQDRTCSGHMVSRLLDANIYRLVDWLVKFVSFTFCPACWVFELRLAVKASFSDDIQSCIVCHYFLVTGDCATPRGFRRRW